MGHRTTSRRPYPQPRRFVTAVALLAGATGLASAVTRRAVLRVEVRGASMSPTLQPGDRVVAIRALAPRPGDIVAVADPRQASRLLVKRASALRGQDVELVGDNRHASTDSRVFGVVPRSLVAGRVVWRYWPPAARGPVGVGRRPDPIR